MHSLQTQVCLCSAVCVAGLGAGGRAIDAEPEAGASGWPQARAALPAAEIPGPVALPTHCCLPHQVSIALSHSLILRGHVCVSSG